VLQEDPYSTTVSEVLYRAILKFILFSITAFKLVIAVALLVRSMVLYQYCTFQLTAGLWYQYLAPALKFAISYIKDSSLVTYGEANTREGSSDSRITDVKLSRPVWPFIHPS